VRPGQQPAGQIAYLGEFGQVGSLEDEVRARHGRLDISAARAALPSA